MLRELLPTPSVQNLELLAQTDNSQSHNEAKR